MAPEASLFSAGTATSGFLPAPLMIAPQHGGIIQGALIETFLDKLESLKVGLDIIIFQGDGRAAEEHCLYQDTANTP